MKSETEITDLNLISEPKKSFKSTESFVMKNAENLPVFSCDDSSLKNLMSYIDRQLIYDGSDRVCIVSIIGKSAMKSFNSKANYVPDWVEPNLFNARFKDKTSVLKDNFFQIDGYYDVNNRMILLHLTSIFDTWAAVNVYENLEKQLIDKGFLTMWPNLLSDLFKSLLLLFYVSNIVILTNPAPRFDIGCINMLRIIDSTRIKLQPFVSELLNTFNGKLSTNVVKNFCIPQMLFIFEAYDGFDYIQESNIKFFVKQAEEQIMRLLRKTRLINSLFTISSLSSFVFIATKTSTIIDYDEYFFEVIFNRCSSEKESISGIGYLDRNQKTVKENMPFANFILPHINSMAKSAKDQQNKPSDWTRAHMFIKLFKGFKDLIFKQTYTGISKEKVKNLKKILDSFHSTLDIDNRFSEGRCHKMVSNAVNFYKDNLPSHYNRETHERKLMLTLQHFTLQARGPAIFKYIKIIQSDCTAYWNNGHKMCEELSLTGNHCIHKVHRLPPDDYSDGQQSATAAVVGTDSDVSDANQPIIYHNSMIKMISACDCGRRQSNREDPFTVKAANYDFYLKMKYKCHTCRNIDRYKFFIYDALIINNNLDNVENLSSSQNMNSRSEARDSPLIMKTLDTMLSQEEFCDEQLFKNDDFADNDHSRLSAENLSNNGDTILLNNDEESTNVLNQQVLNTKTNDKIDIKSKDQSNNNDDDYHSSSQSQSSDDDDEEDEESNDDDSEDDDDDDDDEDVGETENYQEYCKVKNFLSEEEEEFITDLGGDSHSPPISSSTNAKEMIDVRSLPPMIHTLCDGNLPARFSSWSLVCHGSSSIYSHNLGIQDQQGFVKGSHYLLPWNVTVLLQHGKNIQPLWEGKRPPGIKHKKTVKNGTQFTVKIFIGIEYECFRGHRFMVSKPDQILQASTHKFKENADIISKNDMPLYMHCVCSRADKVCIAQLMRVHVVTPKAPIHVTLNPMVQMTPNTSLLFYPGNKEPIKLSQSSYWVLRLPMIYVDGGLNEPYRFPEQQPFSYCRLLKGCFGIADQEK